AFFEKQPGGREGTEGANLVSTASRRVIPLLPFCIRWREGWGERPRATLLPAGVPPLPIGWGEGQSFLRPLELTRCARTDAETGGSVDLTEGCFIFNRI